MRFMKVIAKSFGSGREVVDYHTYTRKLVMRRESQLYSARLPSRGRDEEATFQDESNWHQLG
jgi:hypothetical protein